MSAFNFEVLRYLRKDRQLTLEELAQRSGVSFAAISKLERNIGSPGLDTLKQIASALDLSLAELMSMIEIRESEIHTDESSESDGFLFRRVKYSNAKVICATGKKGCRLSHPEVHKNDTEIVYVRSGRVRVSLPTGDRELAAGTSIQFDAFFPHAYEVLETCDMIIVHARKDRRF